MEMEDEKLLVDRDYLLEKFPGKGGWTYAYIPEILPNKHSHFGWVNVKGAIDDFEIRHFKLMPMGNGKLFLPVNAEIRKKIKKQAGDHVRIILYEDKSPTEVPEELKLSFQLEPNVLETFLSYSNDEQKAFINWIYSAKTDDTKIDRIARTIDKIILGRKLNEKIK